MVDNPERETDEPCSGPEHRPTLLQEPLRLNNALVVGPLALPYSLLLVFAAMASALYIGNRIGRKACADIESVPWQTLLVGLVSARLSFVWEFRSTYSASPLDIADVRDGGWNATAGFVAAWLFALSRGRRLPALHKPLRSALMVGTVV